MNPFSLKSKPVVDSYPSASQIVTMEHLADLWPLLKSETQEDIRSALTKHFPANVTWHLDYWLKENSK